MKISITREEIHYKRINLFQSNVRCIEKQTDKQSEVCYLLSYTTFSNKLGVWGAISKNCSKMSPGEKNPIDLSVIF